MITPRIETDRLILRPPTLEDFDAVAASFEDGDALKYIGGAQPRPLAWRNFTGAAGSWMLMGFGMFSVIDKSSGLWVGRVGPQHPVGWPGPEVGWHIVREAWGRGYAVEAASASMDFAFDTLGWETVIHCIAPANLASRKVAERLGSTILRTATMPPPSMAEVDVWGQTREQWRARKGV